MIRYRPNHLSISDRVRFYFYSLSQTLTETTISPITFKEAPVVSLFNNTSSKESECGYNLEVIIGASIVQCYELVVAERTHPAHYRYFLSCLACCKQLFDLCSLVKHVFFLFGVRDLVFGVVTDAMLLTPNIKPLTPNHFPFAKITNPPATTRFNTYSSPKPDKKSCFPEKLA
jgi:hypothetical protein